MKSAIRLILSVPVLLLSACAFFQTTQTPSGHPEPKQLAVPVGKHWQVVEEPPVLTNERDERPAFQKEQSVQPPGVVHGTPTEEHKQLSTPQ
jgi:hypothetical protein